MDTMLMALTDPLNKKRHFLNKGQDFGTKVSITKEVDRGQVQLVH